MVSTSAKPACILTSLEKDKNLVAAPGVRFSISSKLFAPVSGAVFKFKLDIYLVNKEVAKHEALRLVQVKHLEIATERRNIRVIFGRRGLL